MLTCQHANRYGKFFILELISRRCAPVVQWLRYGLAKAVTRVRLAAGAFPAIRNQIATTDSNFDSPSEGGWRIVYSCDFDAIWV